MKLKGTSMKIELCVIEPIGDDRLSLMGRYIEDDGKKTDNSDIKVEFVSDTGIGFIMPLGTEIGLAVNECFRSQSRIAYNKKTSQIVKKEMMMTSFKKVEVVDKDKYGFKEDDDYNLYVKEIDVCGVEHI